MNNESEIIHAIASGDKNSFSILYKRFSGRVYNTALSYSKNLEDAEEITQDVFVKIYRSVATFKGDSSLNTWIYRIVVSTFNSYSGTAAVTQGLATSTTGNIYPAGQRIARIGTIRAAGNSDWTAPADVNYSDSSFPFAPDLYNPDGTEYTSASQALLVFDDNDIIEIDTTGEIITDYIFADNYFELYINSVAVGKDVIPFTQFNSHIVKFKVNI